uniref:Uncharacterized protein n=1 Tax=Arundo donax TaxID=35708 RepID=A0A0A9F957_ARUDO
MKKIFPLVYNVQVQFSFFKAGLSACGLIWFIDVFPILLPIS